MTNSTQKVIPVCLLSYVRTKEPLVMLRSPHLGSFAVGAILPDEILMATTHHPHIDSHTALNHLLRDVGKVSPARRQVFVVGGTPELYRANAGDYGLFPARDTLLKLLESHGISRFQKRFCRPGETFQLRLHRQGHYGQAYLDQLLPMESS